MKRNKIFSLDEDLVVLLADEANASSLINRLLFEHYKKVKSPETVKEEYTDMLIKFNAVKEELDKIKQADQAKANEIAEAALYKVKLEEAFAIFKDHPELQKEYNELYIENKKNQVETINRIEFLKSKGYMD